MEPKLRRLIEKASKQTGISKSQGMRIYTSTNKIILDMIREAPLVPPNAKSIRIFLRNIGTYDIPHKVIYAINHKNNETV